LGFVDREASRDDEQSLRRIERATPTLEDVALLALAARSEGKSEIDIELTGFGREWATWVTLWGLRGRVVARVRDIPRGADRGDPGIDSGAISRILVRFGVIEILDMHRREQIRRMTPRTVLPINQRRMKPKNVTIR
jgi:hypothetical protein